MAELTVHFERLEPRRLLSVAMSEFAPSATPDEAAYATQYGLATIGAPAAWDRTTGYSQTIVAGIDSGMEFAHPDLYLNVWLNQGEIPAAIRSSVIQSPTDYNAAITFRDLNYRGGGGELLNASSASDLNHNGYIDGEDIIFDRRWANGVDSDGNGYVDDMIGWDFADNDNDPYDHNGHGTHTAGTVGAIGNNGVGVVGVNWAVQLMPLKIFSDKDISAPDSEIASAIYYAANMGARVSNNSYGGSYGQTGDAIYNAIAYAGARDHLFVAAAGNEGLNNDTSMGRSYPASYDLPNIISVAASDSADQLAYFSNFGRKSVDIAAPGVGIVSTVNNGGYGRYSGTSMATPHVAGAAALMLSLKPNLAAWQVKYAMMLSADKTPSLRHTVFSGGRLDLAGAMDVVSPFRPYGFFASPQVKSMQRIWSPLSLFSTQSLFDESGESVMV